MLHSLFSYFFLVKGMSNKSEKRICYEIFIRCEIVMNERLHMEKAFRTPFPYGIYLFGEDDE